LAQAYAQACACAPGPLAADKLQEGCGAMAPGADPKALLSEIDDLLNNEEDGAEAEAKAREAVDMFKEAGDAKGTVDAIRYLVQSWKLQINQWRYDNVWGCKYDIKDCLKQGDQYCMEALEEFKASGDTRGQGAMLLSLAQLNNDKRGPKKRALAFDWATQAEKLLRLAKDDKLMFQATLCLSNIHFSNNVPKKALEKAQQAVHIAIRCGEKESHASALYMVAMSLGLDRNLKLGLEAHMEALNIYRDTGNKKMQAFELFHIADWQIKRQRPREALPPAQEALALFQELNYGKGWHGTALRAVVECHLARGATQEALKQTVETMNVFKEKNDRKMITLCYDLLAHVYLACDDPMKALDCAEAAVSNCKGMQDEESEALYRQTLVLVQDRIGEKPTAIENATVCADMYARLGDAVRESRALIELSHVYVNSGNASEALKAAKKAGKIAEASNQVTEQANALMAESAVHYDEKEYGKAIESCEQAAKLFSKDRNVAGEGIVLGAMAQIHEAMGNIQAAMSAAKKGRLMLATSEKLRLQANGYQTLADLHMTSREYRSALKLGLEAKVVCHKAEDKYGEIAALVTILGACVQLLGGEAPIPPKSREFASTLEKAQSASKAASSLVEKIDNPNLKGVVKYWNASITVIIKDHASALDEAKEALSLLVEGRDRWNYGRALFLMGTIYQNTDEKEKAIDHFKECLNVAKETKDKEGQELANKVLIKMGAVADPRTMAGMSPEMMQQMMMAGMAAGPAPAAISAPAAGAAKPAAASAMVAAKAGPIIPSMDQVKASLIKLAAEVAAGEVNADIALMDAGVDSLASVQFRNDVAKEYDLTLPASLMFDYPTIQDLAQHIVGQLEEEAAG